MMQPQKQLNVFVNGEPVAILSTQDGFEHHLTYLPSAQPHQFVSLAMPVQAHSWTWPALHPFFQLSLPEGFLLSMLKEQLGPHLGASPIDLLAVVGHNMIGRVQVSAGRTLSPMTAVGSLDDLLHGEHSGDVFLDLMTHYARSGVSGVVPKFLTPEMKSLFRKGTISTDRYIVKASSEHQPFVALNEHLCMRVAAATGAKAANTMVSDDGQVLVVERFDVNDENGQHRGFEDFCSLLGLPPDNKYESTWERVARLVREYVDPDRRHQSQQQLAITLLLTYALGNADCHTKNLAFLYEDFSSVRVAPIYDMLTILAYDRYAQNPPGMYLGGRKVWKPIKHVWVYLQQHLGFSPAEQRKLVDLVCSAVSSIVPDLIQHTRETPGFAPVGSRMLWEWNEGMNRLQDRRTFVMPSFVDEAVRAELPEPQPATKYAAVRIGESTLMAPRKRKGTVAPPS